MYDADGNLMEAASDEGFFSAARDRVASFISPVTEFAQSPAGSQLFSAIYEYGRGKIDAAREKAVGSFLMTSEGKRIQSEATKQTLNQYFPHIAIGGAAILLLIFALFSKK